MVKHRQVVSKNVLLFNLLFMLALLNFIELIRLCFLVIFLERACVVLVLSITSYVIIMLLFYECSIIIITVVKKVA